MARVQRYFLTENDGPEREVDVREYVNAEKRAGFNGRGHLEEPPSPACASFGCTKADLRISGRTDPLR